MYCEQAFIKCIFGGGEGTFLKLGVGVCGPKTFGAGVCFKRFPKTTQQKL